MDRKSSESFREFSRDTTERDGRERGLDGYGYPEYLGFKIEDLKGLKILDLGTGETEKFSRELKEAGINATVVCLNPDYGPDDPEKRGFNPHRDRIQKTSGWQKRSVAAIAQELPFADASFDRVFGLFSVTVFASSDPRSGNPEATERWMREIARVLKRGGEARLAPVTVMLSTRDKDVQSFEVYDQYRQSIDVLKNMGVDVEVEMITYGDMGETQISSSGTRVEDIDPNKSTGFARLIIRK